MAKKIGVLVAVVSVMWTFSVSADSTMGPGLSLDELDTDGDEAVSAEEFEAHALARWVDSDENRDGRVTEEEMRKKRETIAQERFGAPPQSDRDRDVRVQIAAIRTGLPGDTDGDGAVTKAEAIAAAKLMMRHMDQNADGLLTADELRRPLSFGASSVYERFH